ncbi:MAG: metalloregulator ArsR/SmtB family transcription factor [Gemmatimonadota bacterium]|nr:metalloregulator ArsR/SmtB family transcription factor [Gemmatimonadota bacterium]
MPASTEEEVFRAVADATRREILDLLSGGERPAGEIADAFPVSRPAVSRHLRMLREADLVASRKEGRRRLYSLNPEPLRKVDEWVSRYERFWGASLERLKAHVERDRKRRE